MKIFPNEIIVNTIEHELNKIAHTYPTLESTIKITLNHELDRTIINHISAITKEAYTNCIKYANATAVHITMFESLNYYLFTFKDNGKNKTKNKFGIGLYSMQVRANKLNAKLTITDNYDIHLRIPKGDYNENIMY